MDFIELTAEHSAIPEGYDLVVMEKGQPETAIVLFGFDEVGLYNSDFKQPTTGFLRIP